MVKKIAANIGVPPIEKNYIYRRYSNKRRNGGGKT